MSKNSKACFCRKCVDTRNANLPTITLRAQEHLQRSNLPKSITIDGVTYPSRRAYRRAKRMGEAI